jgi:hypothetical protein
MKQIKSHLLQDLSETEMLQILGGSNLNNTTYKIKSIRLPIDTFPIDPYPGPVQPELM